MMMIIIIIIIIYHHAYLKYISNALNPSMINVYEAQRAVHVQLKKKAL